MDNILPGARSLLRHGLQNRFGKGKYTAIKAIIILAIYMVILVGYTIIML